MLYAYISNLSITWNKFGSGESTSELFQTHFELTYIVNKVLWTIKPILIRFFSELGLGQVSSFWLSILAHNEIISIGFSCRKLTLSQQYVVKNTIYIYISFDITSQALHNCLFILPHGGTPYNQEDGLSIGSPLWVTLAKFLMIHLENILFCNPPQIKPTFYCCYADDSFLLVETL